MAGVFRRRRREGPAPASRSEPAQFLPGILTTTNATVCDPLVRGGFALPGLDLVLAERGTLRVELRLELL